jgi:hypothetical protein
LHSVFFIDANIGYAAGEFGTILNTTDGGITWNFQISGTGLRLNSVFYTNENTGYIVGAGGTILKTTNGGGTVGISEKPVSSSQFAVRSYPNPTRGIVDFRFSIFDFRWVSLIVYNAQGQEVAVVVDEDKPAGEHTIRWNADGMPAGIYYYTLRNGKQVQTGKIVLVR